MQLQQCLTISELKKIIKMLDLLYYRQFLDKCDFLHLRKVNHKRKKDGVELIITERAVT